MARLRVRGDPATDLDVGREATLFRYRCVMAREGLAAGQDVAPLLERIRASLADRSDPDLVEALDATWRDQVTRPGGELLAEALGRSAHSGPPRQE